MGRKGGGVLGGLRTITGFASKNRQTKPMRTQFSERLVFTTLVVGEPFHCAASFSGYNDAIAALSTAFFTPYSAL